MIVSIAPSGLSPDVEGGFLVAREDLVGELDGWRYEMVFRLENGEPIVQHVDFAPAMPAGARAVPTQRALRHLKLGHVLDEVRQHLTADSLGDHASTWLEAFNKGRRPGRSKADTLWYAEWAKRRVEAEEKAPGRPIKWLHEQYGQSEASINALLHKARNNYGLLEGKPPVLSASAKKILGMED